MSDEAEIVSERQSISDYERRLAKDIVMMLLETRVDARSVLGPEPINLPVGRLARVRYAPMATEFRSTAK